MTGRIPGTASSGPAEPTAGPAATAGQRRAHLSPRAFRPGFQLAHAFQRPIIM